MQKHEHSTSSEKKLACIINPSAANKKWQRRKLLRKYIQENLPGKIIDSHEDKSTTIQAVKELCKDHDIIVAAGGDGTIADVIQGMIECQNQKNVVLGIIPLGSGNALCHSLGIPRNVRKAIQHIKKGKHRKSTSSKSMGHGPLSGASVPVLRLRMKKSKKTYPGFGATSTQQRSCRSCRKSNKKWN